MMAAVRGFGVHFDDTVDLVPALVVFESEATAAFHQTGRSSAR